MLRIVATWHAEIQWLSSPRLYRCREHLSQLGPGFECDIQEIPPRKFPYEPSAPYRWRRVTIWADQASPHLVGTTDLLVAHVGFIAAFPRVDPARKRRSEERRVGKECVSRCRSRW